MDKWHYRFMNMAELVAEWSKDKSTKVGSVIVDERRRIISCGYNGLPRGVEDLDERYADRKTKYAMVVHSEINSLLNTGGRSVEGCTIYTSSLPPCSNCSSLLIQAGIRRVVYRCQPVPERWMESVSIANTMFKEAGVEVIEI